MACAPLLALKGKGGKTNPDKVYCGRSGWVVVVVVVLLDWRQREDRRWHSQLCGSRLANHVLAFAPRASNWRTSAQNSSVDYGGMEREENSVRREDWQSLANC